MNATVSPSFTAAVVCSIFLGWLGVDRMITGRVGLGIAKLLLWWLTLGVWPIVDIVLVCTGKARDGDGKPLIDYGA